MLKCGDTFLAPTTSAGTEHLWIIITEPDAEGKAVAVSITTQRSHSETTVTLNIGEHPFIKHPSVISYKHASIVDVKAVLTAMQRRPQQYVFRSHAPCTPELLEKIRAGMTRTKDAPKAIKQRCMSEWGIGRESATSGSS
jgi:hypothetical protein